MKLHFGGRAVGILAGLALIGGLAQADPIVGAGTFNIAGGIYVSTTAIDFSQMAALPPGDQKATVVLPEMGQFSDMTPGQSVSVTNLSLGVNAFPGTTFNLTDWITLPDGVDLDLTDIPINTSVPVCSSTSTTECRAYATSPVVLTQGPNGVTAALNLSGNAHMAGSTTLTPFSGRLSANFDSFTPDGTIAGLLADFNANGHITTGFEATFTTTTPTSAVPEPGALAAVGLGLLGAGLLRKRKTAR